MLALWPLPNLFCVAESRYCAPLRWLGSWFHLPPPAALLPTPAALLPTPAALLPAPPRLPALLPTLFRLPVDAVLLMLVLRLTLMSMSLPPQLQLPHSAPPTMTPAVKLKNAAPGGYMGG